MCILLKLHMQSLMFLGCFDQKLSKKTFGGSARPPLGTGRVKDLLYESTSRKVLANCDFYGPKTEHSHVDSESEVYWNFIRFST